MRARSPDLSVHSPQRHETAYILRLADNALILGQRLAEMCARAPEMELDMALMNIALDLIGQAKALYEHILELEQLADNADVLAMTRPLSGYTCCHMVSRPNRDFAWIVLRQYLFSSMQKYQYEALLGSSDKTLAALAEKSLKEIAYHIRFARTWVIRLGDGTEESHQRLADALSYLWRFSEEMWQKDGTLEAVIRAGISADFTTAHDKWLDEITATLDEAGGLRLPEVGRMLSGGYQGEHDEHLGHILKDLQFMQLKYPGLEW